MQLLYFLPGLGGMCVHASSIGTLGGAQLANGEQAVSSLDLSSATVGLG